MPEDQIGPIQKMLERYAGEQALRFHMPGHKGLLNLPGATYDVTEVPGTDSLFAPDDGIQLAESDAARCWRAARSFLLVNGSTAGVHAMVLWAKTQGRSLLLPRDCHVSAVYACASAGLQPVWLSPIWNPAEQVFVANCDLTGQLPSGKSALFLTYPDYYGRCISLDSIIEQLHGSGTALMIDAAHGSHFIFSDCLPPDAGQYADFWVAGAHKTLPAPTQTAFLHVKNIENADETGRLLRGITTTSPSYILMAGLDNSRAFMQSAGGMMDELVENCLALANRLNTVDGLRCWQKSDVLAMGYGHHDPTRLVVDVRSLGLSGWEAGEALRELGVQAEMCDIYRVVLIATVMDSRERLEALFRAFVKLAERKTKPAFSRMLKALPQKGETVSTLREAWLAQTVETSLVNSVGRVAAEPFGAYPPGIPLCMPGEAITAEIIDSVLEARALGGGFFGVRGGNVLVVRD